MKSKWCKQKGNHGWCANRDSTEIHCSCMCHKLRAEQRQLIDEHRGLVQAVMCLEARQREISARLGDITRALDKGIIDRAKGWIKE